MKLSVIICVYNTDKKYLEDCLSSIVSSTLSDYEIVFVDDGSSIDYSDTLAKYKVKYAKTENRGHFAARLYGIELAEGEYITFVDSDDTVSKNYHQPMVTAADKEGADIVINAWAFHTDRTKRCCTKTLGLSEDVFVEGDGVLPFFTSTQGRDHSYFVQWNKIYRRELVTCAIEELSNTEIFKKRITFAEDALLSFFYFKHAKKVISITSGFYFYRIHQSQSVSVDNEKKLLSQIECMGEVLDTMILSLPKTNSTKQMSEDIVSWKKFMSRTHYSLAKAYGFTDLYKTIKNIYDVEKLKISTFSDSWIYSQAMLLGDNFDDIDSALTSVFLCKKDVSVNYLKSSLYLSKIIETISKFSQNKISYQKKHADLIIPKPKSKSLDLIIHSAFISALGILLFPKGSKLRNILKKRL